MINAEKFGEHVYDDTYNEWAVACANEREHGVKCNFIFGNGLSGDIGVLENDQATSMIHPGNQVCIWAEEEEIIIVNNEEQPGGDDSTDTSDNSSILDQLQNQDDDDDRRF